GQLFRESSAAWEKLKSTEAGKSAKSLDDSVEENARQILVGIPGPFAVPEDIESLMSAESLASLNEAREVLKSREAAIPQFIEVMSVSDATPENLKVHLRGSHLTLGKEVPRRFLQIIAGNEQQILAEGSGRLQLADWLTHRSHPLTARVMVNRVWLWHFGQGLVRSPDNFGLLGERPSHPELLDWLSKEFTGNGERISGDWSLKRLHRLLVSTSTYRMSTQTIESQMQRDPENRLLWRFHRQRMDAEVIRDSMLAIGGVLDETPGGTMLTTPNRNYVTSTASVNPAVYNGVRRSIYLPVVRSALYEVFSAFDFADPSTINGQRDRTTIAPQALFMMNSEFVLSQSRLFYDNRLQGTD
ncbi:MAG: DUF1553 domain-containing protein, partial [Planctomycetes bacterium]|nr:DUF1553 domain-containing protein [Planctomycetota bacterium]